MRLIAPGLPFLAITSGGTLLIRSDGSPRFALFCSMAGVALNFVLDYLFLFPLNMGIAGAALATVTGQIVSALLVVGYMLRFRTGKLERTHFAVTSQKITQIISIGAAGSLNQAAMFVMNLVLNSSLSHYGALSPYGGSEALAAAGVVTKINFLFYSTTVGCAIGGQPIMGFNYGAGKYDRVKETFFLMLRYVLTIGAVETACFWLFPHQILALFGSGAGGYEEFALRYMHEFMLLVILAGILPISMNTMVSIKRPRNGVIISLSKQLGDAKATAEGVRSFLSAFVRSMPTGKQNTFANRTLPSAVLVALRDDQPVNGVSAFEEPVTPREGVSISHQAEDALAKKLGEFSKAYGDAPVDSWWCALDGGTDALREFGSEVTLPNMLEEVSARVLDVVQAGEE